MTISKRQLLGQIALGLAVLLFATQVSAQGGMIVGKVTDADTKEALPASTVQIPKLKIGAKSDIKGDYRITKVPPGTYTVEARLIGYQTATQTVTVAEGESVTANFNLLVRALRQEEIVVMGLSGEIDRRKLGNAVGSVDGGDVARATTPTAIDAISGRVPGVVVTRNSGTPGAGTYMTIRGRKTISGSSEPLYVVDGVPIDNTSITDQNFQSGEVQLANRAIDINPSDIESMEVLKGAAAAALYGSLAANGVVLITTKKGSARADGNAGVYFSTAVQTDNAPTSYPLQKVYGQRPGSNLTYGPKLADGTTTYDQWEVPLRTGLTSENTLSITGGAASFNYLLSGTWTNNEGIVKGSELERRNIRMNLRGVVLSNLDIQSNNNFISIDNDLPQDGSNTSGIMLGSLRTPPEFDNSVIYNADGSQHQFFPAYDNPLWTQENNTFNTSIARFIHSTTAKWDPFDWLRITGLVGLDKYNQENRERMAVGSRNSGGLGSIEHTLAKSSSVNTDLTATATFMPVEELELSIIVGGQTIWSTYETNVLGSSQTLASFDEISAGANKDARSELVQTKLVGMFGQVTGTAWDKLSVTLGLRRDGSSTFSQFDKFHTYPKAGFSYQLSKEEFMEDVKDIFSSVKIRGSYGAAGSPSLPGAYTTNNLYTTFGNNDGWGRLTTAGRGGFTGIRQGFGTDQTIFFAGASNISPEVSIEREIGIDLGMFDNRVNLEFTYYYANVHDLILDVPVPGSTGYEKQLRNAGAMHNQGFEVSLGAWPVRSEDFSWNTIFNYSSNKNEVTRLLVKPGDDVYGTDDAISIYGFTGIENVALVGHQIGVFRGAGYVRNPDGTIKVSTGAGDDSFGFDFAGAPLIDDSTHIIGDPNPDFTFSWRNDITFLKDFNVSFLVDASIGGDIWNGTRGALYRFGTHGDTKDREDPWVYNGKTVIDNATGQPVTREFFYRYYANSFSFGIDEAVIEDGSYVKLREVSLSYRWRGLQDIGIGALTFTASARNLFTITDYTGFDPEVNNFAQSEARGYDYFNLPQTRSFRFGVSLTY